MADAAAKFYEATGLFRSAELTSGEASPAAPATTEAAARRARSAGSGAASSRAAGRHISVAATSLGVAVTGHAGVATT